MRLLSAENQQADLIYLMGGDSLADLPEWQASNEFVKSCHSIGVMRRPGKEINLGLLETQIPGIEQKIRFFDTPIVDIAASQIRHRIKHRKTYRYYLPESVYRFIRQHNLYV
jgi:nicotinate-nucleotide adenylyltransferase